jgi:hypothetical protein
MGVFDWLGTASNILGWDAIASKFRGTFAVTCGDAISGIFGTTIQSYYGPYITHVVDARWGGLGGLVGAYLNESSALLGLLGVNGYVTWVYGPNITVNYGGPVSVIQRAAVLNKTATKPTEPKDPIPLDVLKSPPDFAPTGEKTTSGDDIAAADRDTLNMVHFLSLVLNLTVATLELTVKFKYTDFDPTKDNQPVSAKHIDTAISLLVPSMMGMIYGIEKAGGVESWGSAVAKNAKDIVEDVVKVVTYPFTKHQKAKTKEAAQATTDAVGLIALLIDSLLIIGAVAAIAGALDS